MSNIRAVGYTAAQELCNLIKDADNGKVNVDASNIGVNATVDNSEDWGNAIGGGTVTLNDKRLVTGGTVYTTKNSLASAIATNATAIAANTTAIETNTQDIANNKESIEDNTEDIVQNTGGISANSKRIGNIEKLLQGNLYDYDTDDDTSYTKSVPSGAMPYAGLEKVGGKTIVWNSLVNPTAIVDGYSQLISFVSNGDGSVTFTGDTSHSTSYVLPFCSVPVGHKVAVIGITNSYHIEIYDAASPTIDTDGVYTANSSGQYRFRLGSTTLPVGESITLRPQIFDLTLMFGAGNEPTFAQFKALFPASYYSYSAPTLLSAGVTEVVSNNNNLFNDNTFFAGKTGWDSSTHTFSGYINAISGNPLYVAGGYEANTAYTIQLKCKMNGGNNIRCQVLYTDSTYALAIQFSSEMQTATFSTDGSKTVEYFAFAHSSNGIVEIQDIKIEKGATATPYRPYGTIETYPIPTAIRNLEGYGWSAGTVYNYVDFERKKFVQNVGRVDISSLNSWDWASTNIGKRYYIEGYDLKQEIDIYSPHNDSVCANIVCSRYATTPYESPSSMSISYGWSDALGDNLLCIYDNNYNSLSDWKTAMSGVYLYYELSTPIEMDISEYLNDDNLIQVEVGGAFTFPNQNGDNYRLPVPSEETYMIDLQEAISNG